MSASDYRNARSTTVSAATRLFSEDELQDAGLVAAVDAVRIGETDHAALLGAERAAQHYDEVAFTMREAAESHGDTSGGAAYLDAFRKARAASAIKELLGGNYERALYEARHALGE